MKNDRWASPTEIKRVLVPCGQHGKGGHVLYHENGCNWVFPGEGHSITLGMSGVGKSRRGIIPSVEATIRAGESGIVFDSKGEIYHYTGVNAARTHEVHVIDFSRIGESEGINLLQAPYENYNSGDPARKEIAIEQIDELAHALYATSSHDPFWTDSARSVFIGAAFALLMYAKPEQVNLANVFHLISKGNERFGTGTYLKEFVQALPEDSVAATELFSYVTTAEETRAGIRSTFLQGISKFVRSEGRRAMLSANDLRINQLDGVTPTMIYILLPDESPIYLSIAASICSQLLRHYIRIARDEYNGKLPCRLNVFLEELSSIGRAMPSLSHLMSASRSRCIRCHLVLQSLSQLDTIYGASDAETIKSNADVLIAFRVNHWDTLVELSKKCGEREVEYNNRVSREPLISPTHLAAMDIGQALVIISGRVKFITRLPDFTQMFDYSNWEAPKYTERPPVSTFEFFDIKEWVKEHRRSKMFQNSAPYRPYMPPPPIPSPFELSNDWPTIFGAERAEDNIGVDEETRFNIDAILESISLTEIDEEEEESEESSDVEKDGYSVILISVGAVLRDVIQTVRKHTDMKLKDVRQALSKLPYTFYFSKKEEAKKFLNALSKTTAVAISGNFIGYDEDDDEEEED